MQEPSIPSVSADVQVRKLSGDVPALGRCPASHCSGAIPDNVYASAMSLPWTRCLDRRCRVVESSVVHAIFAADAVASDRQTRLARAEAILARWHAHEVGASDVLGACDRLHQHLERTWPQARIRREVPIFARLGAQLVSGRIDLAVEDENGFSVIDHKSFPGSRDRWEARASGYGPQLGLYAEALLAATGRPCERLYIHMPIVGTLLRVARRVGGSA